MTVHIQNTALKKNFSDNRPTLSYILLFHLTCYLFFDCGKRQLHATIDTISIRRRLSFHNFIPQNVAHNLQNSRPGKVRMSSVSGFPAPWTGCVRCCLILRFCRRFGGLGLQQRRLLKDWPVELGRIDRRQGMGCLWPFRCRFGTGAALFWVLNACGSVSYCVCEYGRFMCDS